MDTLFLGAQQAVHCDSSLIVRHERLSQRLLLAKLLNLRIDLQKVVLARINAISDRPF